MLILKPGRKDWWDIRKQCSGSIGKMKKLRYYRAPWTMRKEPVRFLRKSIHLNNLELFMVVEEGFLHLNLPAPVHGDRKERKKMNFPKIEKKEKGPVKSKLAPALSF
jgi:hypothetical protein